MSRQYNLANVALVLIFSCMISNALSTEKTIPYSVSWLNFNKDSERFTLTNPHNGIAIQFSLPQSQAQAQSIQITGEGFWKANYKVGSYQVDYIAKQKEILLHVGSQIEDKIQVLIKGAQNYHQNIYASAQSMQNSFKPIAEFCDVKQRNKISCTISGKQQLYLLYSNTANKSSLAQLLSQTNNSQKYSNATVGFLRRLNVAECPLKYASDMLTYTLSSICVEKSEYLGYEFYGFCANGNNRKIDRYYSLLVIEILFSYNEELAQWLVENFLDLLEQKLFYSFQSKQWIPIPEHIQVFLTYLNHVTQNSTLFSKQIKNRINKVIQIQNGLINNLLLSQVNHLSEQINYRQNNKVHPTILKMLNQAWKTDLPRARVSSIYAESFTSDFFYHEQDEKLDSSVGKMAWLIKLVNQHVQIVNKFGDSFQKQSMEQVLSLAKVIQGFFLDDPRAKNGQFQSVIITEKQRMYSQSIGYETLLPFTYKISPIFPQSAVVNLTTTYGLASMPPKHPKSSQTYNFRGNINLYFNYKILFGFFERCQQNPKQYPFINNVKYHIDTFQKKILDYFYHPNRQSKVFYTSWAGKKGHSSQKYLAVINVAFLRDLNSQLSKWASKNSDKDQAKK